MIGCPTESRSPKGVAQIRVRLQFRFPAYLKSGVDETGSQIRGCNYRLQLAEGYKSGICVHGSACLTLGTPVYCTAQGVSRAGHRPLCGMAARADLPLPPQALCDGEVPVRFADGCPDDPEEARRRWAVSCEYKRKHNVFHLLQTPQPLFDTFCKIYPMYYHKCDKQGRFVAIEKISELKHSIRLLKEHDIRYSHQAS